ncbi:helix-turn-helix transcriptional regulator [Brevibacillus laterosporus]|uniref:helix-turn-helix domain-containing protein n=1 Tax=Brevibacillus laterosporus TaxID=1465 RepID=UPI002E1F168D|nr:helix-turn-helix transcriptional regulator [Brevibacillus laterosporus]
MSTIVRLNIDKILKEYNLSQDQLANLSGVRQAAISEMSRNKRAKIELAHLEKIAKALNITDISKLISLEKEI